MAPRQQHSDPHDNFESEFAFDEACDALSALGLALPQTPANQRIVGGGGRNCQSLHGVSLEQLFDAIQAVQDNDEAVDSATKVTSTETPLAQPPGLSVLRHNRAHTDVPKVVNTGPVDPQKDLSPPQRAPRIPVQSSRTNKGSRSKRAERITSYFSPVQSANSRRAGKLDSVCSQCDYVVTGTDTRYMLFHVILCSKIPFSVRLGIYFTSNDKEKPPLIEAPPHHCEHHQARIIYRKQTQSLEKIIEGYLSRRDDLSRDQSLARWMMAKANIKMNRRIDECSAEEEKVLSSLVLDFIVEENIPFAVCGNRDQAPRPFGRILNFARPGYEMPPVGRIAGPMLTKYYGVVKQEIKRRMKNMLPDNCRVTIMFDGSEDVKSQPVINVLMRVMGRSRASVKTYFLKSVYTGYDTCDASYYVSMVEKVVEEFGGFESIAGVVTDNTSSVVNARHILQSKHSGLVASQDQAHVADLLMSDIGEIPWIRDTLKSVATIGAYLRRFRKIRAKLVEMMDKHNMEVRKELAALRQDNDDGKRKSPAEDRTEDNSMPVGDTHFQDDDSEEEPDDHDDPESGYEDDEEEEEGSMVNDDVASAGEAYSSAGESGGRKAPRFVTISNILSPQIQSAVRELAQTRSEDEEIVSPCADQLSLNPQAAVNSCAGDIPRFARFMKKVSTVRFASLEKLLHEYKSLRKLLLKLLSSPDFASLCSLRSERDKSGMEQNFVLPIKDDHLFRRVLQVHYIMKACRIYLRMFDSESCLISEVVRATTILEQILQNLPLDCFPEPRNENHQEMLEIFRNRKEGPLPGRKRVQITLISDLHVAAALLDPYRCPFDISAHKQRLRDHLEKYLSGSGLIEFQRELEKDEFIVEMMNQYDIVHFLWKEKGYVTADSETTSAAEIREGQGLSSLRTLRHRSPISWWTAGSVRLPKDGFAKKAAKALVEFAVRTLSVSPTATATERTFSHLSRIQPKQRSGLSREKVEKLLFCQWNLRVLRKVANAFEVDVESEAKKQNVAIDQLRAHRKHVATMSFLGSIRSNADGVRPVLGEPVTAQNQQPEAVETVKSVLPPTGKESGEAGATAQSPCLIRSNAATQGEKKTNEQQDVGGPASVVRRTAGISYGQLRNVNDGDGSSGVLHLEDVLRAAMDAGYSMRHRQGERNTGARLPNMRDHQVHFGVLPETAPRQAPRDMLERNQQGNKAVREVEKDEINVGVKDRSHRLPHDDEDEQQGDWKRRRVNRNTK